MDRQRTRTTGRLRLCAALALVAGLAACGGRQPPGSAEVDYRGTQPGGGGGGTAPAGTPRVSGDGLVQYDGYVAARARDGETVAGLAGRIGLSASELAAYNGLSPTSPLRGGDELVLPPRPGGYAVASAAPETARTPDPAPAPQPEIETRPLDAGTDTAAAPEPAPQPGDDGWSPELALSAIDRADGDGVDGAEDGPQTSTPGSAANPGTPPSAGAPLPDNPPPVRDLASPELSQYQTARAADPSEDAAGTDAAAPEPRPAQQAARTPETDPDPADGGDGQLARPVEGPVALGFRQGAGGRKNDGVDFAAPAGAPVVAAEAGEVALVSEALGGLGTIVLIRHPGELLTVYGRISGVSVAKGDFVERGQRIGVVAETGDGTEPRMHFEVREGANSVDPMAYL